MGFDFADGGHDRFADAGDDGFLGGAADEAIEIGTDGDARLAFELNTVLGHGVKGVSPLAFLGAIDDSGLDDREDGFQDVVSGEIDGRRAVEIQRDLRLVGRDEAHDHAGDIAPRPGSGLRGRGDRRGRRLGSRRSWG